MIPIEDGRVIKNLTERDIQLLQDLYQYQVLNIKQIRKLHFSNSEKYVYKRLFQLKREGFVKSRPLVSGGQKVGAGYFITEKGLRILEEQGLSNKRRARDITPSSKRIPSVIERNELYTQLLPFGWTLINSRDYKKANAINRGALVSGALVRQDGKEYVLYILENNIREQTFHKVCREIKMFRDRNVLILCKGQVVYEKLWESEDLYAKELNILPFHLGMPIMQWLNSNDVLYQMLQRFGVVTQEYNRFHFGDLMVRGDSGAYFVANCLMGDKMALHFLKRYSYDVYQRNGVKVLLLHWDVNQFHFPFDQYPHVQSVPFYLDDLSANLTFVKKITNGDLD
ncbi:replication-relaxation family protein [Brevibacillus marinus]|uniref:replication-relaxation family protein n=1 Tax=Brevibacillus marinus TaxID=2496837 RepID=UPI0019D0F748|nr:replication-relaxation family protein [Brevibacillus marinus]